MNIRILFVVREGRLAGPNAREDGPPASPDEVMRTWFNAEVRYDVRRMTLETLDRKRRLSIRGRTDSSRSRSRHVSLRVYVNAF